MPKIIFMQPAYAHYRDQLFKILSKRHDIYFLFESSDNTYPGGGSPQNIQYTFIDQKFNTLWLGTVYYLLKYKPEIVISSVSRSFRTMISFLYTIILRKKMILWIEEWRKPLYKNMIFKYILGNCRNIIGSYIIINSDALIVSGTASYNYAMLLGKNENKNVFFSLQCVSSLHIHKSNFTNTKREYKKKYTFLYLSRIIALKGLDILIKAFSLFRKERDDIELIIAGDGPFREHCINLSESLNTEDIKFIGSIDYRSTFEIFDKADVFVLPSYIRGNEYEKWGLVINEAMSMSLPIITTKAVGASYDLVVDAYNGFSVKDNNVYELYNAMKNILDCDLSKMGSNSKNIFNEKNDYLKMADGFTNAINCFK